MRLLKAFILAVLVLNFILEPPHAMALSVPGPTYAIARMGDEIWTGGAFGLRAWTRDGSPLNVAPDVGGCTIYDLSTSAGIMYAAGDCGLFAFNYLGQTMVMPQLPELRSVLVTSTTIYAGGRQLYAFNLGGQPLDGWTPPVAGIDPSLRHHTTIPAFRDLVRTRFGIAAACQCDSVNGQPTKALVGFDLNGTLLNWPGPRVNKYGGAFGISLAKRYGVIYAGFGGSDSVEAYSIKTGDRLWRTDVSGSAQVVRFRKGNLWVGGHFRRVADDPGEQCDKPVNPVCYWSPHLVVLHTDGSVLKRRTPSACCAYNGIWSLLNDGNGPLWIGGAFSEVGYGWYPDTDPGPAEVMRPRSPVPALNLIRLGG